MNVNTLQQNLADEIIAWQAAKHPIPTVEIVREIRTVGGGEFSTFSRQQMPHWTFYYVFPQGGQVKVNETFNPREAELAAKIYQKTGLLVRAVNRNTPA